jgi:hypothetical protein
LQDRRLDASANGVRGVVRNLPRIQPTRRKGRDRLKGTLRAQRLRRLRTHRMYQVTDALQCRSTQNLTLWSRALLRDRRTGMHPSGAWCTLSGLTGESERALPRIVSQRREQQRGREPGCEWHERCIATTDLAGLMYDSGNFIDPCTWMSRRRSRKLQLGTARPPSSSTHAHRLRIRSRN